VSQGPRLSIIIPAYNEEARLGRTLKLVFDYLKLRGEPFEILVVDDGSQDQTVAVAQAFAGPCLRLLRNETNRGKGYSVRRGMLEAEGERRLLSDADLSTPIGDLVDLESHLADGAQVAVGSRALPGSRVEVRQPWYRENAGRVFNLLVRLLAVPGIHDTQCGFKLFTAAAAEAVFRPARLHGFSFDVEVLFLARRLGLRVDEVAVTWRNDAATRVSTAGGARAFFDLLRIRAWAWRGLYGRL
jgi:dolichyl-phosphate beta-glucosyltransferase